MAENTAAANFAQGVELQGNLMSRIVEMERQKQFTEQSVAMLPLRLQGLELENEASKLNLISIAHNNTVQAARLRDEQKLTGAMAKLAMGEDPGEVSFETSDASKLYAESRSKSAIGMQVASKIEQFNRMLSDPLLRGEDVSTIMNMPMGKGGIPTPEAFRKLSELHNAAVAKAEKAKMDLKTFESNLDAERQLANIRETGKNRLDVAQAKAMQVHAGSSLADAGKKAAFLRQLDIIKNDKALSSEAKAAKIDELSRQFQESEKPGAATPPQPATLSQDALDEISVNNEQIKILLGDRAELMKRKAKGETGKNILGIGTSLDDQIKSVNDQIQAFRDANAKLRGAPASPAPEPAASKPPAPPSGKASLVVKRDGSVVSSAAASKAQPQAQEPAQAAEPPTPTPAPVDPEVELNKMIDSGQRSKDAVAAAFWEIVADKLNVQPQQIGSSSVARKARTVAKSDPRIRKYYESLPAETKQKIMSEVLQKSKENPEAFIPVLFDYMLLK